MGEHAEAVASLSRGGVMRWPHQINEGRRAGYAADLRDVLIKLLG